MGRKRLAMLVGAVALLTALAAIPALADPQPITIEPLTPRSTIPDDVDGQFKVKLHGQGTTVINMKDPARTIVAKITVQPGAMFPWHTHAGPVLVNIAQGELIYVPAHDCSERAYDVGEAFLDPGHGHVHSAYNRGSEPTILIATFFQVAASGPLTLTEGISQDQCPGVGP